MIREERLNDLEPALRAAMRGWMSGVWTSMPAIIQTYDPSKLTCTAQCALQARVTARDGTSEWVDIPVLVDVPVLFPSGGGFTLTFPIAPGDEALIFFASRCIDAWWQLGGVQQQAEIRMHDLSDGFAFVGPRSQKRLLPGVSTSAVELRSDDDTMKFGINQTGNAYLVMPTSIAINAPVIFLDGDVDITGDVVITGAIHNNGKNIGGAHTHSGVSTGSGNTGAPT